MAAPPSLTEADASGGRRTGAAVLLCVLLLLVLELALQVRSQFRTGQSVLSVLTQQTTFSLDPVTGLRLLRPASLVRGQRGPMQTNRYGLRGPDFEPQLAAGERRIALLGSSTIMGTYASSDARTSSAQLQSRLEDRWPSLRVINAGVAGLTIGHQVELLTRRLLPLGIELVVWYPGTADLTCESAADTPRQRGVPVPTFPEWFLLPEIVNKNTVWLRDSGATQSSSKPVADFAALRAELRRGIAAARAAGVGIVLVTSARAYDSTMAPDQLERRARSAIAFRPCYSAAQLALTSQRFDEEVVRAAARAESVPLIDATHGIGTDPALFGDSTHLSDAGEARLAELLDRGIMDLGLFDRREPR